MMRIIIAIAALAVATAAQAQDKAAKAKRDLVNSCEASATADGLQGDARKQFIDNCIQRGGPRRGLSDKKSPQKSAQKPAKAEQKKAAPAAQKAKSADKARKDKARGFGGAEVSK